MLQIVYINPIKFIHFKIRFLLRPNLLRKLHCACYPVNSYRGCSKHIPTAAHFYGVSKYVNKICQRVLKGVEKSILMRTHARTDGQIKPGSGAGSATQK